MKPTLFGYGKTTKAIAAKLGGGCTFFDDNATEPYSDDEGNRILPSSMFDPDASELEITTPSLKPDHPLIKSAKSLMSEYDYIIGSREQGAGSRTLYGDMQAKNSSLITHYSSLQRPRPLTVWISGTNGKTTTTQMLTHLLKGRGAVSGGNIGTPLADLDPEAPIWILESSSYTLHHTRHASPSIYLLLPITPDHLDWHGTAKEYEADKLRPLTTMREGELALVPKGLNLPKSDAWIVEYDSDAFIEEFFTLDGSKLRYKAAFLQDALLSLAITRTLFDEADYELLNAFTLDHHRQEEVRDHRDRLWVNDSKATNVDATIQAIMAYADRPIRLILGGDDKGVDLGPLMDLIAEHVITVYTIGSNSDRLSSMAKERGIAHYNCGHLQQAIAMIDTHMHDGEVALLSPAAASLDQFPSYAKRGEIFLSTIKELSRD